MNRAVLVLAFASLGAIEVGCIEDPCASPGNGKQAVLSFGVPQSAQGLQTGVTLYRGPPRFYEGPFLLTRDPRTCYAFDDAEVQVTLPDAFGGQTATVARPEGQDLFIQFNCNAPDGVPQEVNVRVVAGDVVRYQDAFDITCHALTVAEASAVSLPERPGRLLTGNGYAVGGLVHVKLSLGNQQGGLFGFGAPPADALLGPTVQHDFVLITDTYRAAAPGRNPALQVASLRAELPITLVDGAGWDLGLEAQQETVNQPNTFLFSAWPLTQAGAKLDGMEECQWTASTANQSQVLADTACDITASRTLQGLDGPVTKMCVTSLGKSACTSVPP